MSNRRRATATSRSYTARLRRRTTVNPPSGPSLRTRWWRTPWLAPMLAVTAEVGHLAAAYLEWPGSAPRGAYHVIAGGALGLLAVTVHSGPSRVRLAIGAAVAIAGPTVWLAGTLLGTPPYHHLPAPGGIGIALTEATLAALLVASWPAVHPPSPAAAPRNTWP